MSNSSEIVDHLIIPTEKVPASAYQAIYHKLTNKVERLHEIFDEAFELAVSDIAQLHDMLCQTVRQYPVQGQSVTVSISFHKDERLESSSMERFRMLNFSTNKPTEVVEYKFDFYTILPVELPEAQDIVQRFKVTVKMDQDFMEEDEEGVPFFVRGMISGRNIRLSIEYSDYAVGRNLQVCVQDWVMALNKKPFPRVVTMMERHSDMITHMVPYVFGSAALFGASGLVFSDDVGASFRLLIQILAFSVLMIAAGKFLIVQFYRQVQMGKPLTFFTITHGDRTRRQKVMESRRLKYSIALFLLVTIVLGIVTNLFSSYIWEKVLN